MQSVERREDETADGTVDEWAGQSVRRKAVS
jgi:hypothetical protein